MVGFPTLPPRPPSGRGRITQRDITPTATRRRHQVAEEREITATVSPKGETGGDFSDLQEAINQVNAGGGGTVLLKPGTYPVATNNLVFYSNMNLIGADNTKCIIDFQGTTNVLQGIGVSNVLIEKISFKNNTNTVFGAIYCKDGSFISIENCTFDNNKASGGNGTDIFFDTIDTFNVSFCQATNGDFFFFNQFASGSNLVNHNKISSHTSSVMRDIAGQCSYDGNFIETSTGKAFSFDGISFSNVVNNIVNVPSDNTDTIFSLVAVTRSNFIGNHIIYNTSAYKAMLLTTASADNQIIGNDFESGGITLRVTSCSFNRISANTFTANDSGASAVLVEGNSDQNVIVGNGADGGTGGTTYGIRIEDSTCDTNLVVGNVTRGDTAGVSDNGTGSVVASNV